MRGFPLPVSSRRFRLVDFNLRLGSALVVPWAAFILHFTLIRCNLLKHIFTRGSRMKLLSEVEKDGLAHV